MQKAFKYLLIFVFTSFYCLYGQSKVGTTAANFLTIPIGVRATGMGGAFVAVADDGSGAYWNPGGLSRNKQGEVTIAHTKWIVDTKHDWLSTVIKLDNDNTIAFSINQLDYGEEEITTERDPEGTGQNWEAVDVAIGLSYARNLTDRFSIGGTAKYVRQKIWNETASSFALDVGLLFKTQLEGLNIGMSITNFGTEMKLDGKDLMQAVDVDESNTGNNENIVALLETDSWNLPLLYTLGLSYETYVWDEWKVLLACDAVYPNNNNPHINAGTEIAWNELLFIRVGGNSLFDNDALGNLSAGVGLACSFGKYRIKIDYSYMDYGIFEGISRYGISIMF